MQKSVFYYMRANVFITTRLCPLQNQSASATSLKWNHFRIAD